MPTPAGRKVLILGGGHNGLVCASLLARSGLQVTLIESQSSFGGAASTYRFPCGCELSRAASSISLFDAKVFELIREYACTELSSIFIVPNPQTVVVTPTSSLVLRPLTAEAFAADLSAQVGEPVASLLSFLTDLDSAAASIAHLWTDPYASLEKFTKLLNAVHPAYAKRFLRNSIQETIAEYFVTEDLQLVLGALSSIVAAPFTEPGTSFCLLYLSSGNLSFSPNYALPVGEMGPLFQLLYRTAVAAGVRLYASEAAVSINVLDGKVHSVSTHRGRELSADIYVSGFGPITTDLLLSSSSFSSGPKTKLEPKCYETSCAKLNCLLPRELALEALAYRDEKMPKLILCGSVEEFTAAAIEARLGVPTDYPYVELLAPSLVGAEAACPLHIPVSLYALYFPYDWCLRLGTAAAVAGIDQRVRATLARWRPEVASAIEVVDVHTPVSLEGAYGMWHGDVDHGSFAYGNILDRRGYGLLPHGVTSLPNLFNCSAGIHPGGLITGRPAITCSKTILGTIYNE